MPTSRVDWRLQGAEAEGWRDRPDVEGMGIAESASDAAVPPRPACYSLPAAPGWADPRTGLRAPGSTPDHLGFEAVSL